MIRHVEGWCASFGVEARQPTLLQGCMSLHGADHREPQQCRSYTLSTLAFAPAADAPATSAVLFSTSFWCLSRC